MGGKRKHTRRMHKLRTEFFEEGKRLDADPETRDEAGCWLCPEGDARRIDYSVPAGTTEDSHNLDHATPVDDDEDLQDDPDNFRHAHRRCNESRGKRAPSAGLGEQVADWW